jgi:hypothetical protein
MTGQRVETVQAPAHPQAPAEWLEWLDQLAEAATELERRLGTGEPAVFPQLPHPPLREGAGLPEALVPATRRLLDRLDVLQRRAEAQQEALLSALEGLPRLRPRARIATNDDLGAALDVAG